MHTATTWLSHLEPGSITELIALLPGILAIMIALWANRIAQASAHEAHRSEVARHAFEEQRLREDSARYQRMELRERERDAREQERERRLIAGSLQAWWATDGERWGLVISNSSRDSSVFHDIKVTAPVNRSDATTEDCTPVSIEALPPGRYFVEARGSRRWGLPEPITPDSAPGVVPVTRSTKHHVASIEFTDHLGSRWRWEPKTSLVRLSS